jgi:succinate dehydrogenase/fumarate reductase-like Fe-S protein
MTKEEAQKIRSAFSNGFEYPFGKGYRENCDMFEVERHAALLDALLNRAVAKKVSYAADCPATACCPACGVVMESGKGLFCNQCGQALLWN